MVDFKSFNTIKVSLVGICLALLIFSCTESKPQSSRCDYYKRDKFGREIYEDGQFVEQLAINHRSPTEHLQNPEVFKSIRFIKEFEAFPSKNLNEKDAFHRAFLAGVYYADILYATSHNRLEVSKNYYSRIKEALAFLPDCKKTKRENKDVYESKSELEMIVLTFRDFADHYFNMGYKGERRRDLGRLLQLGITIEYQYILSEMYMEEKSELIENTLVEGKPYFEDMGLYLKWNRDSFSKELLRRIERLNSAFNKITVAEIPSGTRIDTFYNREFIMTQYKTIVSSNDTIDKSIHINNIAKITEEIRNKFINYNPDRK